MDTNINKFELFPVPVFQCNFEDAENLKNTLVPIFLDIEKNDKTPTPYCETGYTSFGKYNVLTEMPECKGLLKFIAGVIDNIHKEVGLGIDLGMRDSWFSINRKYARHGDHIHLPSTWSGVYYVQAEEKDASLTFVNKNFESNWPYTFSIAKTPYNARENSITPRTGDLWIFPSYLIHRVEEQILNNERITIAFNCSVIM